jgi:hypothetical protein
MDESDTVQAGRKETSDVLFIAKEKNASDPTLQLGDCCHCLRYTAVDSRVWGLLVMSIFHSVDVTIWCHFFQKT